MRYKQSTLDKIVQALNRASKALESGDVKMPGACAPFRRALAEAYPELKANQSFQQLQQRIRGLEETIGDKRAFYNSVPKTIISVQSNFLILSLPIYLTLGF